MGRAAVSAVRLAGENHPRPVRHHQGQRLPAIQHGLRGNLQKGRQERAGRRGGAVYAGGRRRGRRGDLRLCQRPTAGQHRIRCGQGHGAPVPGAAQAHQDRGEPETPCLSAYPRHLSGAVLGGRVQVRLQRPRLYLRRAAGPAQPKAVRRYDEGLRRGPKAAAEFRHYHGRQRQEFYLLRGAFQGAGHSGGPQARFHLLPGGVFHAHGRGLDRPQGLEGRKPVAGQDGGHRVLQDGLRKRQAEPRRGDAVSAIPSVSVDELHYALDAHGQVGRLRLSGRSGASARAGVLWRA